MEYDLGAGWETFWRGGADVWGISEEKFMRFLRLRRPWFELTSDASLNGKYGRHRTQGWERELQAIERDDAWISPGDLLNG